MLVRLYGSKENLGLWMSPTRRSGSFLVSPSPQNQAVNCGCSTTEVVLMVAFPVTELYFLIAKFLSGGPLKETAKVNSMEIHLNIIFLRTKWLNVTFSVADLAKRARERRGKLVLFLVPGSSLLLFWSQTHVVETVKLPETLLKTLWTFRNVTGAAPQARLGGQRAQPILRWIGKFLLLNYRKQSLFKFWNNFSDGKTWNCEKTAKNPKMCIGRKWSWKCGGKSTKTFWRCLCEK